MQTQCLQLWFIVRIFKNAHGFSGQTKIISLVYHRVLLLQVKSKIQPHSQKSQSKPCKQINNKNMLYGAYVSRVLTRKKNVLVRIPEINRIWLNSLHSLQGCCYLF